MPLAGRGLPALPFNAMIWRSCIMVTLLLAIVAACLFGNVLRSQSVIFREFQAALLSVEWMLMLCMAIWCGSFIFLTFSRKDLPLIGLLLISITLYFIGYAESLHAMDAIMLLAGVTLGRGIRFFVGDEVTSLTSKSKIQKTEIGNQLKTPYVISYFLIGLIMLLAFSSWWHLDMAGAYHGPRWMELWDNPNICGMLMGAGVVLAMGLRMEIKNEELRMKNLGEKRKAESGKRKLRRSLRSFAAVKSAIRNPQSALLLVAVGMMGVGLFFSYSRGAWVGTAVGLLFLTKAYGKLKWKFVLPGILMVAAVVCFFWHGTADTDAWYLKRLDLSRPSAQHRVSAWRGALQMMRDHPFGVGWNKAVGVYEKDYSPPEGGAAALTMNSYLMMGTELGIPGLVCFVAYVGLCFRTKRSHLTPALSPFDPSAPVKRGEGELLAVTQQSTSPVNCHSSLQTTCHAGAVMLLVAFWFDGGLFTLATASVFWILLELGTETNLRGELKYAH
jgi:hypothetical protein